MRPTAHNFISEFIPKWLDAALPEGNAPAAVHECLGVYNLPPSTLTQARITFTLAHLYLQGGVSRLLTDAKRIYEFMLLNLRDDDGGFRKSTAPEDKVIRTYDQSFVLLAMATLHRADPAIVSREDIENFWDFITSALTENDGSLRETDQELSVDNLRAQNPHMHMLEAVLQCYEMTENTIWLERAKVYIDLAETFFIDAKTGAVREFVGADLKPIDDVHGQRREPGHQYEWAWLLQRYATFAKDEAPRALAKRMCKFADNYGVQNEGPLQGALFDALYANGEVTEPTHLLWPLTEAGKLNAALYRDFDDEKAAKAAKQFEALIFEHYFINSDQPIWVNQYDSNGNVTWGAALSRLLYHVALFVTEGISAKLWEDTSVLERKF